MPSQFLSGIRARLFITAGAPVLATCVIAALAYNQVSTIRREADAMTGVALPASLHAMDARMAASDALKHTRGAMITTEDAERTALLADGRASADRLTASIKELGTIDLSPGAREATSQLQHAASAYTGILGEVWTLLAQNSMIGTEQATDLAKAKLPAVVAQMDKAAGTLQSLTADDRKNATAKVGSTLAASSRLLTWGPAFAVALAAGIGLAIARSLVRQFSDVRARFESIARRRDPLERRRVEIKAGGEIGDLVTSFNMVADDVRGIVTRFSSMAGEVNNACSQIAAATEETNATVTQQSSLVHNITTVVDDLSARSETASRSAGRALEAASGAGKVATAGEYAVQQTIEGMRSLSTAVTLGAQSVDRLGKRSEQVGAIISVIDDIAEQTNLLALNAAIEAARAGEHGRGFAVVADEVRKLAERTTKATQEVAQTIKMIQDETMSAVQQMTAGTARVEESVKLAEATSSTLSEIVKAVRSTVAAIDDISREVSAQKDLGESIRTSASTIVSSTDEVSRGTAQAAEAVSGLLSMSSTLAQTIGEFATASKAA